MPLNGAQNASEQAQKAANTSRAHLGDGGNKYQTKQGHTVSRGALNNPNLRRDMKRDDRENRVAVNKAKSDTKHEESDTSRYKDRRHPLFIMDDESVDTIKTTAIIILLFAIAIGVYIAGVVANVWWATILSFLILILSAVIWIWRRRKRSALTAKQIDEEVEKFRQDLIETYNGYDVDYTNEDVNMQLEKYRLMIEEDNASIAEISPKMMIEAARINRENTKRIKENSKTLKRMERSRRKKQ